MLSWRSVAQLLCSDVLVCNIYKTSNYQKEHIEIEKKVNYLFYLRYVVQFP